VVKVVVLLPRRSDMSSADFERHLRQTHIPMVAQLPGLWRLVVNYARPDPNAPPVPFDAVAEDWFDDPAAMGAAFGSPEGQALAADTPNFVDIERLQIMVVEEEEIALPSQTSAV